MFSTLITVALFASAAIQGARAADEISLSTPTFTQCEEVKLDWKNGVAPYNLIIVPAADTCADPIHDLGDHTGTSMTWKVALPAGMQVQMSLLDTKGNEAWSGKVTVAASKDNSCVPKNLLAAASSVAPAAPSSSASASAPSTPAVNTQVNVPAASPTGSAVAVGAANAGTDPLGKTNGARSLSLGAPMVILGSIAGAVALLL